MSEELLQIFRDFYQRLTESIPVLLTGLFVIILFIVLGKIFYSTIGRRIQKRWKDNIVSNFIAEASKWAFYLLGIIIALNIVGFGGVANSLIAGAGVSAIIFGFAFKDIGENFLAGIILALKRPFEIGDIIEVDGQKGTIRDLDLRTTHLRNVEGKDIYVPNSLVVKNTLINYTRDGNLRNQFMVGIAPECSIEETRKLILDYLVSHPQILKQPVPLVVVQELGEFTVDIQVLFWVDILANKKLPDTYLGDTIRSKVITDIKALLEANNIEMPSQVLEHKMYRNNELAVRS